MRLVEVARFVDRVEEEAAFYRVLLGREPASEWPGGAIFMDQGVKIFLHERYEPGDGDLPPEDHLAFAVEDVDATCDVLQEQGLTIEVAPRDYYWGRSAYLRSADGQLIELIVETPAG